MGFFTWLGSKADKAFEWAADKVASIGAKIVTFTKKLIDRMKTALRSVAMLLGKFFSLLTQWIDKAINYVKATFGVIVHGVQTLLKKVKNEYQEISYNYTKQDDGSYMRNTVVRQTFVSEDEIPADIKEKAKLMEDGQMIDMSEKTADKQEYAENTLAA